MMLIYVYIDRIPNFSFSNSNFGDKIHLGKFICWFSCSKSKEKSVCILLIIYDVQYLFYGEIIVPLFEKLNFEHISVHSC